MEIKKLDKEDLAFLNEVLPMVLESLKEARDAIITDRSLTMEQLLDVESSVGEGVDRCTKLIDRVREEMNAIRH